MAFIERVNSKNVEGVIAEPVRIDKVVQGSSHEYAVIIDRISQDVPFYRAFLKNAAISGRAESVEGRRERSLHGAECTLSSRAKRGICVDEKQIPRFAQDDKAKSSG